ncbi:MAG: tetratricopeptide repeat protein [Opitutaceae bacterium]|nr:tetratricopeptide repeat protein [Opitutaceae bacterium]
MVTDRVMRHYPFLLLVALTCLLFGPARLAADLVWSPQTGWRIEGGVLTGLTGNEARTALDLMNKARSAEDAGSLRRAIRAYTKVTKKYPNSIYAPEAFFRIGMLREKRHQYFKAFDALQELVRKYPSSEKFSQVIAEQYRIANLLLEGKRNYMWGIIPGFRDRSKAVDFYEQIITNAPYSDYASLSLMNAARAHQILGNPEEAIDVLDRMINFYPKSVLTPDAYLKLAQTHASLVEGAYYDQASTKEAITYYEDYLILFPNEAGVATAEKGVTDMKRVFAESKIKIADFYYLKRSNFKAARVFYNEAITIFPDSDVAANAKQRLAEIDAREQKLTTTPAPEKKKKRFLLF